MLFEILINIILCFEIQAVAVLVIFGCALAAPTPRVGDQNLVQANKFSPSNAIKELESSLDNIDAIFKQSFQKIGMYEKMRECS